MTLIQVNPALLNKYGKDATQNFGTMATSLGNLVTDINTLEYAGKNAKDFKDACGEAALQYVNFMNGQLTVMANAIMDATRGIEQSLGGATINFKLEPVQVSTAVEDASAETVVLDLDQLEQTKTNIEGHFDSLSDQLIAHEKAFGMAKSEWFGQAAEAAATTVTDTTKSAKTMTDNTKTAMSDAMKAQLEVTRSADGVWSS